MDTRLSPEQETFREVMQHLADAHGPGSVASLADERRRARLRAALDESGVHELRASLKSGTGPSTGVEVGLMAQAFGRRLVDVPYQGILIAAELGRLAGQAVPTGATVALAPSAERLAVWDPSGTTASVAIEAERGGAALGLVPAGRAFRLAAVQVPEVGPSMDLTRPVGTIPHGAPVDVLPDSVVDEDAVARAELLGLVLAVNDMAGLMRGAHELTLAYAAERRQFGVTIGSFQAVQHRLAESLALVEAATSVGIYAAWALDALPLPEAQQAGRVAKIFSAGAAREVCETAIQIHGGIGNTWECMAHLFLRRALHSVQLFGNGERWLERLADDLLVV